MLKTVRSRHQIDSSWLQLCWEVAVPWSQSPARNPTFWAMIGIQINWRLGKTWDSVEFLWQISIYCNDADVIIAFTWRIRLVNNEILIEFFKRSIWRLPLKIDNLSCDENFPEIRRGIHLVHRNQQSCHWNWQWHYTDWYNNELLSRLYASRLQFLHIDFFGIKKLFLRPEVNRKWSFYNSTLNALELELNWFSFWKASRTSQDQEFSSALTPFTILEPKPSEPPCGCSCSPAWRRRLFESMPQEARSKIWLK